ncbi:hypothetical protein HDU76_005971, partial [Blyttiomyces sp. JEL0837]
VPTVVIRELDGLKTEKENKEKDDSPYSVSKLAKLANDFLYKAFLDRKLKRGIRGQKVDERLPIPKGEVIVMTNDDRILECCRYCQIHYSPHVFLLSNDKNLCVKAMIQSITPISNPKFGVEEFLDKVRHTAGIDVGEGGSQVSGQDHNGGMRDLQWKKKGSGDGDRGNGNGKGQIDWAKKVGEKVGKGDGKCKDNGSGGDAKVVSGVGQARGAALEDRDLAWKVQGKGNVGGGKGGSGGVEWVKKEKVDPRGNGGRQQQQQQQKQHQSVVAGGDDSGGGGDMEIEITTPVQVAPQQFQQQPPQQQLQNQQQQPVLTFGNPGNPSLFANPGNNNPGQYQHQQFAHQQQHHHQQFEHNNNQFAASQFQQEQQQQFDQFQQQQQKHHQQQQHHHQFPQRPPLVPTASSVTLHGGDRPIHDHVSSAVVTDDPIKTVMRDVMTVFAPSLKPSILDVLDRVVLEGQRGGSAGGPTGGAKPLAWQTGGGSGGGVGRDREMGAHGVRRKQSDSSIESVGKSGHGHGHGHAHGRGRSGSGSGGKGGHDRLWEVLCSSAGSNTNAVVPAHYKPVFSTMRNVMRDMTRARGRGWVGGVTKGDLGKFLGEVEKVWEVLFLGAGKGGDLNRVRDLML